MAPQASSKISAAKVQNARSQSATIYTGTSLILGLNTGELHRRRLME